jgi:hypothetical protein
MSWLRLDDRFATNTKVSALPRADRWAWVELLCYCALNSPTGRVPPAIVEHLKYVTPALLERCRNVGLIDTDEHGVDHVHDWAVYNPKDRTQAERAKNYRDRHRDEQRDANRDASRDERHAPYAGTRARSRPVPLRDNSLTSGERGAGWVENLSQYTGARWVKGTHGSSHVPDTLGTDRPPSDWPHPRPTRQDVLEALKRVTSSPDGASEEGSA